MQLRLLAEDRRRYEIVRAAKTQNMIDRGVLSLNKEQLDRAVPETVGPVRRRRSYYAR